MSGDVQIVLRAQALNGEAPVWCARRRRLFWVDLRAPSLHEFDPATGQDRFWEMPAWIGCYGLTAHGAMVALRTGLFHFDFRLCTLEFLAPPPFDPRRFLFNDGRCDPRGRFIAGTMYLPLAPGDAQPDAPHGTPLWRYGQGARWQAITPDVEVSNGSAFSPDGGRFYHSDTARKRIWVWDYDVASGDMANRRVFASLEDIEGPGGPDGANIDAEGFYWCAVFGAGVLRRYDPDGKCEREIKLPVRNPTMPAFGGEDRRTLYVTSAAWPFSPEQRRENPDEGALLALPAPAPGLPEPVVGGL